MTSDEMRAIDERTDEIEAECGPEAAHNWRAAMIDFLARAEGGAS